MLESSNQIYRDCPYHGRCTESANAQYRVVLFAEIMGEIILCNALLYNRQICYCQLYHLSLYVSAVTQIVKPFRNFTHANWTAEMCSVYWPNLHLLRQSNCCVVSEWSHIELSLRNRHFLCTLCFIFSFGWCLVEDYRNGDQRRPMGPCGSKRTLAF